MRFWPASNNIKKSLESADHKDKVSVKLWTQYTFSLFGTLMTFSIPCFSPGLFSFSLSLPLSLSLSLSLSYDHDLSSLLAPRVFSLPFFFLIYKGLFIASVTHFLSPHSPSGLLLPQLTSFNSMTFKINFCLYLSLDSEFFLIQNSSTKVLEARSNHGQHFCAFSLLTQSKIALLFLKVEPYFTVPLAPWPSPLELKCVASSLHHYYIR